MEQKVRNKNNIATTLKIKMSDNELRNHVANKRIPYFELYDWIVTWTIGLAFLLAGMPHWGNPYYFLGSVYSYRLVDPGLGQVVAMTLPLIQLVVAICLLSRLFLDAAHLSSLILLCVFTVVQTVAYFRGLDISCGCFAPGDHASIGLHSLSLVYFLTGISISRNIIGFFRKTDNIAVQKQIG